MNSSGLPLVSVCIPVFNGAAFVAETIDCALAQSHENLEVLISVDCGDDRSAEICAGYETNPRVTVFHQPTRLGWAANTNFLLDRVGGAFFSVLPHDDLIPPHYVSRLLDILLADRGVVNAYPSISGFGDRKRRIRQRTIRGDRPSRVLDVVSHHTNSVSFRGLVRSDLPAQARRLAPGLPGDRLADTLQILHHALHGSLVAVDEVVYRKRYHSHSEHHAWRRLPPTDWLEAWLALAVRMAVDCRPYFGDEQYARILGACRRRALGMAPRYPPRLLPAYLNPLARVRIGSQFDEAVRNAV